MANGPKQDEIEFLLAVANMGWWHCPRNIINEGKIHHKRAWYLLEKWARKGWYEYGVTLDLGWITGKGKEAASEYGLVQSGND